jgi:hypothetical protein
VTSPLDTREHCAIHSRKLLVGERCRECAEAARVTPVAVVTVAEQSSVELDDEMRKLADEAISYSKFLHRVSRERIEDGNPNDWSAAAKLIAEGVKLLRYGTETKEQLAKRAHSRYLVEHEKDIKGMRRKGN